MIDASAAVTWLEGAWPTLAMIGGFVLAFMALERVFWYLKYGSFRDPWR